MIDGTGWPLSRTASAATPCQSVTGVVVQWNNSTLVRVPEEVEIAKGDCE